MEVTTTGLGSRDVEQFATELSRIKQRLDVIEVGLRTGQLGNSSVENGYLSFYDDDGIERARIGKQDDGTYAGGVNRNNNIPPQVPNTPVAEPVIAGVRIKSTGPTSGTWPADFSHINVWQADGPGLNGRVVGTILGRNVNGAQEVFIVAPLAAGTGPYRFWLTSVNLSKAESAPSNEVTASPLAVVGQDILAGAINELQLADDAVTQAKIAAGAVGTAEIAGQAVDLSKLADGSVSAAKLIDGAVETEKIAAAAIVSDLIAANAVIAGKVAANAITTVSLAANAVSAEKIAAAAISAEKIAAAAITAEKILALAITSDKISANAIAAGHIQAGAVTAAKLEADMVIANRVIAGSATGARTELHPTNGLQAFTAAGLRTLWADSATGNLTAIGTFQTGITGERINVMPNGTLLFYPATGTSYAAIRNDGSNILFHGLPDGSNRAGFMNMSSTGMTLGYGTIGSGSQTSGFSVTNASVNTFSPYVKLRIDGRTATADGSNRRVEFAQTNSSGTDISASIINYYARTNGNRAVLISPVSGVGFVWDGGAIAVTQDDATTHGPIVASRFDTPSSQTLKHEVRPIQWETAGEALTPLEIVRRVEAREWEYVGDRKGRRPAKPDLVYRRRKRDARGRDLSDENGLPVFEDVQAEWDFPEPDPPKHYGPMAEDLQALAPTLVNVNTDGLITTDIRDLVGVLWHALGESDSQVRELRAELADIRAALREDK